MVDPTAKGTKHIKDRSKVTEGYLEYTKENEKGKVKQLDVGNKKFANVTVFYITLLLFFLKKSSTLFTRNVGHFVLFMLFTCFMCIVVSITFFSALYIGHLVLFLLFLLILGTQWILSLVPRVLVFFFCFVLFCFGSLLYFVVFWLCIKRMFWFNNCVGLSCSPHQVGLPCFSFSLYLCI